MTLKMNAALEKLVSWGATCGLSFDPSKTVLLHFKTTPNEDKLARKFI